MELRHRELVCGLVAANVSTVVAAYVSVMFIFISATRMFAGGPHQVKRSCVDLAKGLGDANIFAEEAGLGVGSTLCIAPGRESAGSDDRKNYPTAPYKELQENQFKQMGLMCVQMPAQLKQQQDMFCAWLERMSSSAAASALAAPQVAPMTAVDTVANDTPKRTTTSETRS